MINMADLVVIAVLLLGIGLGAALGAIRMVLSLLSSFAAVVAAFFVQPILLPLLNRYTSLYDTLLKLILRNVDLAAVAEKLTDPSAAPAGPEISPQILALLGKKLGRTGVLENARMQIGQNLAGIAMQILSFFIGFVLILILFALISRLLSGVARLPIIRQLNKAVGAVLGGIFSVLLMWLGMLFLNYWFSTGQHLEILILIRQSVAAKYLYQYNFLVYYLLLVQ
ncbi:hypothetical protein C3V36_14490 [Lachnospiraceae bacterium oral taxon 500]|nr:hypothetical protein C3V36_14490 [Lachnospiraceae bacterium oral taxon 500]